MLEGRDVGRPVWYQSQTFTVQISDDDLVMIEMKKMDVGSMNQFISVSVFLKFPKQLLMNFIIFILEINTLIKSSCYIQAQIHWFISFLMKINTKTLKKILTN